MPFLSIPYEEYTIVPPAWRPLLIAANQVLEDAYAPYSAFAVAAAARITTHPEILTATNLENASYPCSTCAETALLATIHALHPSTTVSHMLIIAATTQNGKLQLTTNPISPCGLCRQKLAEQSRRQKVSLQILMCAATRAILIPDANLLLPFPFSNSSLTPNQ